MSKALLFVAFAFFVQNISGLPLIDAVYDGYASPCAAASARAAAPWNAAYAAPCAGPYGAPFDALYAGPYGGPYGAAFDGLNAGPLAGPLAGPYAAPYGAQLAADALAAAPLGLGAYTPATLAASNGGGLMVTSSSPIAPTGVTLISENAIEGPLAVAGEVPFLGTIALEGALPTAGAGSVTYGCGNGAVGIIAEDFEDLAAPAYGYGYGYEPYRYNGYAGYGYRY